VGDPDFRDDWDPETMLASGTRDLERIEASASALDQVRLHGGVLTPLPFTRREARTVEDAALGAGLRPEVLLGPDASLPRLREGVDRSPRFLHIASHGLMGSTDRPYEASLAFTQPENPSNDNIGFLTLRELMGAWLFRLQGCELVVLSACDTGRGIAEGDTVMSLPLGFFASGAETVVASLWRVDDRAASLLMGRFYENLLGIGDGPRRLDGRAITPARPMPKLDALREAQAWLRSLTREELERLGDGTRLATRGPAARRGDIVPSAGSTPYAHPYYWAAFTLRGSPE